MTDIGEGIAPPDLPGSDSDSDDPNLRPRFMREEVYCGDKVLMMVACSNMSSSGGNCEIKLKLHSDHSVVASWNVPINAGVARKTWVTQKPNDQWPDPEFYFEATAEGITERSENNLTIRKYLAQSQRTVTIPCSSGRFGWTGKFDIKMVDRVVVVRTKIKLINRLGQKPANRTDPLPAIGPPVSAADKARMKSDIEGKLSNKRIFHRARCDRNGDCDCPLTLLCCKLKVRIIVDFVESGQHHRVNLFQGRGRATSSNWTRVKTRPNSYAHETGHLLGWYDEYAAGAVGTAPRWRVQSGVIMATGLNVPAEYYWDFRDWVAARTTERWDVLAPP